MSVKCTTPAKLPRTQCLAFDRLLQLCNTAPASNDVPVHKAFTLQISQCCAELVGKQDESGQIQTVLPHLKERTQLQTQRRDRWKQEDRDGFMMEKCF